MLLSLLGPIVSVVLSASLTFPDRLPAFNSFLRLIVDNAAPVNGLHFVVVFGCVWICLGYCLLAMKTHSRNLPLIELAPELQSIYLTLSTESRNADEAMQIAQVDHGTQSKQWEAASARYHNATSAFISFVLGHMERP
jgi:hypothetical protein